jgi:hypothetical protein
VGVGIGMKLGEGGISVKSGAGSSNCKSRTREGRWQSIVHIGYVVGLSRTASRSSVVVKNAVGGV